MRGMKKALSHFSFRKMISAVLIASTVLTFALPATVAFADPLNDFNTKYEEYINLFSPNTSGLKYIGLNPLSNDKITGFSLNVFLDFPITGDKSSEWHWET